MARIDGGMQRTSMRFVEYIGQLDPEAEDKHLVRHLTDDEKQRLSDPLPDAGSRTVFCMRLKQDDFIKTGFTEGCLGCRGDSEWWTS